MPITSHQLREMFEQRNSDGFSSYTIPQIEREVKNDNFLGARLQRAKELGVSREQALNYFAYGDVQGDRTKKQSFFERSTESIKNRGLRLNEQIGRIAGEDGSLVESNGNFAQNVGGTLTNIGEVGLGIAGQAYSGAFDLALNAALGIGSAITPDPIEQKIVGGFQSAVQTVAQSGLGQAVLNFAQKFQEENPRAAFNLMSVAEPAFDLAQTGIALKLGKSGAKAAKGAIKSGAKMSDTATKTLGAAKETVDSALDVAGAVPRGIARVAGNAADQAKDIARVSKLPQPLKQAVRAGFDEEIATGIFKATDADRAIYRKMLELADNAKSSAKKSGKLAPSPDNLPRAAMGDALINRGEILIAHRDSIGSQLGEAVRLAGNSPVDLTDQYRAIVKSLSEVGIDIRPNGTFRNIGSIPDVDAKKIVEFLETIRPDRNGKVVRTFSSVDSLRKKWFKQLKLDKKNLAGVTKDAERVVDSMRGTLLNALDDFSPGYRELSEQYARTVTPLNDLLKFLNVEGAADNITTKSVRAAQVARRIASNNTSKLMDILDPIEARLVELGIPVADDLSNQAIFSNLVESVYGLTPENSFKGAVRSGVIEAGDVLGGTNMKINAVQRVIHSLSGVPQSEQIKVLKGLLDATN